MGSHDSKGQAQSELRLQRAQLIAGSTAEAIGTLFGNAPWGEVPFAGRRPEMKRLDWTCCCWYSDDLPGWMGRPIWKQSCLWLTPATLLWMLNLIAMIFHLTFAGLVLGLSIPLDNWKTHGGVILSLYRTKLDWGGNCDPVGPSSTNWLLAPKYVESDAGLNLTWFTICFFLLSAFFHFIIVVLSVRWTIYYWWIDQCRQPLRWIEYSFSASVMLIIIAFFGGNREGHLLLALFTLSFCTMTYGWVTEALSRPDPDSRYDRQTGQFLETGSEEALMANHRMKYWEIGSPLSKRDLLLCGCWPGSGALQRLGPNLLGYIPYCVAWYIILETFYWNVANSSDDQKPPGFVYAIIWAEVAVFTSFAIVSLVQQASHWGCRNYWLGEVAYLILSMIAKGLLGCILLANILLSSMDRDGEEGEMAERLQRVGCAGSED